MKRAKKHSRTLSGPGRGSIGQPGVAATRVSRGGAVGSTPSPLSSPHNHSLPLAPFVGDVGVERHHDYRIGAVSAADATKTERPAVPAPPVGAGSGFRGI